jgi:endonuclease/exonuclease/phosphatase family metal-dependent hydrolase
MKKLIFPMAALWLFLSGCGAGEADASRLVIMSWNVQNLFDDIDNGTEYREYDPANGEWTYDSFSRKAAALADVITAAVPGGPDIVLLQEIENDNALKHLNEEALKASGYKFRLFFQTDNSAIGCGVLSRLPISAAYNHAVNYGGQLTGRNISELHFVLEAEAEDLCIFLNHWKSKLGGAEETEPSRIAAAMMLCRLMREAAILHPGAPVMAAGDFNESYDEFARVRGQYLTAIISGEQKSADNSAVLHCLPVDELLLDPDSGFYNPWSEASCKGSYFYKGGWETIDQFFLNSGFFNGNGWDYAGFETVVLDFNSTAEGLPLQWQNLSGYGCSDHFPIILELKRLF